MLFMSLLENQHIINIQIIVDGSGASPAHKLPITNKTYQLPIEF